MDARRGDRSRHRRSESAAAVGRRRYLAAVAGAGAALTSGCLGISLPVGGTEEATASWTEEYDPPGGGEVVVENLNGPVRVRGEDRGTIEVAVEKRSDEGPGPLDRTVVAVGNDEADAAGNAFAIRTEHDGGPGGTPATVEIDVAVPRTYPVVRATTRNGDASVVDTRGDLFAGSVNGSIEVDGVRGFVDLESENGDLQVRRSTGIDGLAAANGSIEADVRSIRGDTSVGTSNGDVDVRLGPGLDASVRAETVRGSVELGDDLALADETVTSRLVTGRRGEGEHELTVGTSNGRITLREL